MKYEIGERVRIRTDIRQMESHFMLNEEGLMDPYFGEVHTVIDYSVTDAYILDTPLAPWKGRWVWDEEWLEKLDERAEIADQED